MAVENFVRLFSASRLVRIISPPRGGRYDSSYSVSLSESLPASVCLIGEAPPLEEHLRYLVR